MVCEKLALAAVEATDCAIEGTVNCASRDDGRPALTGTDGAAGVANATGATGATEAFIGATTGAAGSLGAFTSGLAAFANVVFTESFA